MPKQLSARPKATGIAQPQQRERPTPGWLLSAADGHAKPTRAAGMECRQLDRAVCDVASSKAIVSGGADGRLLMGASTSNEILGAAEIRTPAFRRSARARGTVRRSGRRRVGFGACFHANGIVWLGSRLRVRSWPSNRGASGRPDGRSDRAGDRARRSLSGHRPPRSYTRRSIEMSP